MRRITRALKRTPTTIVRELAWNAPVSEDYGSHLAQLQSALDQSMWRGGEDHVVLEVTTLADIIYPQPRLCSSILVPGVSRNRLCPCQWRDIQLLFDDECIERRLVRNPYRAAIAVKRYSECIVANYSDRGELCHRCQGAVTCGSQQNISLGDVNAF